MINLIFLSAIGTLILGILLLNLETYYDTILLPPMYNGIYVTKLSKNNTCLEHGTTTVYNGIFTFLEHICSIKDNIEINILNCYPTTRDFFNNFILFRVTTVIVYIEIALTLIIIVSLIIGRFTINVKGVYGILPPAIMIFSYILAKLVIVVTFTLYTIFRFELANNIQDPLPKGLLVSILLLNIFYIVLQIYDTIGVLLTFYEIRKKGRYVQIV